MKGADLSTKAGDVSTGATAGSEARSEPPESSEGDRREPSMTNGERSDP